MPAERRPTVAALVPVWNGAAFLAEAHLIPGSNAMVIDNGPDGVRLHSDAGEQLVPKDVAQLMWVAGA